MQEITNEATKVFQFSGLELFFIGTTILFIIFNLYQLMETKRMKKELELPIHNSLVGLFNDIKSKMNTAYLIQSHLGHPSNPHKEINTLRWEYNQFILFSIGQLSGFQESVVSILSTLNPKDKEGKDIAKAKDYGLSEDDRKLRDQLMQRQLSTQESQTPDTNVQK
ncbi:MAG: hypothetical protein WBC96_01965 [Thermodesulfobacteriota bacterium]